jgi:twitching motility protein PilT
MPKYDLRELLKAQVKQDASDVLLKAYAPPLFRVYGEMYPVKGPTLEPEEVQELVYTILTDDQKREFETKLELDLAFSIEGVSRYRINVFRQRECVGMNARAIPFKISTIEEIHMPAMVKDFCFRPRGMVLITGPTGCGKSTSLAAMIHYINERRSVHIVTIEDPIEFVHEDKMALINQRERGTDTHDFANALRHVTRQDPDVILVGEMRDLETIQLAVTCAETGHLVFGTLHTTDACQTVDRIIDAFPPHQQMQIRTQLSANLVGIISQVLLKRKDGKGRIASYETLVGLSAVRNLIREGKTYQLPSVLQTGMKQGMMSLNQNLVQLHLDGWVTEEAALEKATDPITFQEILDESREEYAKKVGKKPA